MAKIIQVTTFFSPVEGGVEQQVLNLSKELVKKGHQVTVFCSNSTRTKDKIREKQSKVGKIIIKRFPTLLSISQFYKIYPQLLFSLMNEDFDIVHVHGFRKFEVYASLLAAKLKKKKIVVTTHNPFFTKTRNKVLQFFVTLHDLTFGKLFSRYIDNVIALTKIEIPFLERFNVPISKITIVPNGIPNEMLKKGNSDTFVKKHRIPIKKYKHVVLFSGRIHKVKGLENLEIAVKQLKDVLFIFAGDHGNASASLKKLYLPCKNVIFTGKFNNKDAPDIHSLADIFVFPSYHEAFGLVILEAMAQELPIISTNIGGPSDIVKDSFGIQLDPRDQWGWMHSINKLLRNDKLRKTMGENAYKEVHKYKWDRLIDMILNVYDI